MSDVVLRVENLTKEYRLGIINHGTLRQDLQSWWAKLRNKEDPNSLISTVHPSTAEYSNNPHILAINDVSFDVKEGEILGIIGRNGAGKSTLLKILSRVTAPTKGLVKVKGRVASLLEVGTGFHPELTGRENIFLNGAILGMTKKEISNKFDEIVDFSGIDNFIDTPVKRYSSGMYVRLAFAVAAHLEPEILVVDEVLAVGDAQFQKKCLGKMSDVAKGGRTVLFVSHNMSAINQLCPRALLLRSGSIDIDGETDKVTSSYLLDSVDFKGEVNLPAMSDLSMRLRKLSILDSRGNISGRLEMCEPFNIEVEYDINSAVSGAHVICFIHSAEGVNIIGSGDADCSPEKFNKREKGVYRGNFQIPASLLGEGCYSITVSLGIPYVQVFDRHESIISFEIFDNKSSRREWQHIRRPGILGLEFPWDTKKLELR